MHLWTNSPCLVLGLLDHYKLHPFLASILSRLPSNLYPSLEPDFGSACYCGSDCLLPCIETCCFAMVIVLSAAALIKLKKKKILFLICVKTSRGDQGRCGGAMVWNAMVFPTLAMVSWNLNRGSRVSGSSGENWASDRKLVAYTGSKEDSIRILVKRCVLLSSQQSVQR